MSNHLTPNELYLRMSFVPLGEAKQAVRKAGLDLAMGTTGV